MKSTGPRSKLRNKIIAWSFIPTAIILFLVALTVYFAYQQVTEDLVLKRDEELTRLSANEISSSFEDNIDRLSNLARLPEVTGGEPEAQRIALENFRNQLILFDAGTYVLDNLGTVVASLPEDPWLYGQDWSSRSFFAHMIRNPGLFFSNIEPAGPSGENVISIAVPITGKNDEFVGVAVGMYSLDVSSASPFFANLIKLRVGRSGNAYLVDENRMVIYATDTAYINTHFSAHPVVNQDFQNRVGVVRTLSNDGRNIVAGFAPVPRTGWTLVVDEDWNVLARSSFGYAQSLWILLVLGLVIPTAVVIVGVRRITGPIGDFIQAAQRIAGGDFSHPINVKTGDELEELADQFNTMAERLQESYETLETRVAQRTEELTALNSMASAVSRSLNIEQILSDALTETIDLMNLEAGAVFRYEPGGTDLILVAHQGLSDDLLALAKRLPVENSIVRVVLDSSRTVAQSVDDYPSGRMRETLTKDGWKTIVSIPLASQDKILGAMNIASSSAILPTEEQLAVPTAIGQQIGVALDNARLYNQTLEYARQMAISRQIAEEARIAAEGANAAKSNFLANVSHELRTPLVSIFGFTRLIQKRLEERIAPVLPDGNDKTSKGLDQIEDNLQIILSEGQRLMTLINDLLDLEKIEAGKMEWKIESLSIADIVHQATTATFPLFEAKQLSLRTELDEDLPTIYGDADRLLQVVINLISNAVKFTDHGTITIKAHQDDNEVIVEVKDQGVGIDPIHQDVIFEKFGQVGDPLTDKPKGTGLGLAISKDIIEHHGGRIWFESVPGEGTTFSFALPITRHIGELTTQTGPRQFGRSRIL